MNHSFTIDQLPDLPQAALLKEVAARLWQRDDVVAIWLGGSFGSGKADRYSDVDLRIAVTTNIPSEWYQPGFDAIFGRQIIHCWTSLKEEEATLHHLLIENAEMYDFWVQPPTRALHSEPKLILGCRDAMLSKRLAEPSSEPRLEFDEVDPIAIRGVLEMYWSNHVKTEKVIYRDLALLSRDGMYLFTGILMRLKFILATGKDCGSVTIPPMTIHTATPILKILRNRYGNSMLAGMLPDTYSQKEAVAAVDALDAAIADAGRLVAERFHFDYPVELERVVLKSWENFKMREGLR